MNIENFREYCLSLEGVTEKTPFGKFARRFESILVFYVAGRMFCLTDMDNFTYVDVRSTPDEAEEIKMRYSSVGEPVNRTMKHWIQLDLAGDIPEGEILRLVSRAHEIIKNRYTKKSCDR